VLNSTIIEAKVVSGYDGTPNRPCKKGDFPNFKLLLEKAIEDRFEPQGGLTVLQDCNGYAVFYVLVVKRYGRRWA